MGWFLSAVGGFPARLRGRTHLGSGSYVRAEREERAAYRGPSRSTKESGRLFVMAMQVLLSCSWSGRPTGGLGS